MGPRKEAFPGFLLPAVLAFLLSMLGSCASTPEAASGTGDSPVAESLEGPPQVAPGLPRAPEAPLSPFTLDEPGSPFAEATEGLPPRLERTPAAAALDEPSPPALGKLASDSEAAPKEPPQPASVNSEGGTSAAERRPAERARSASPAAPVKEQASATAKKSSSPVAQKPTPAEPVVPPAAVVEATPFAVIPASPAKPVPTPEPAAVSPSRSARLTVGQLLEVPYYGTGWIYLGETRSRSGLPYDSRRLDGEGMSFIFRAEKTGSYVLKFYRQDFVADLIFNDYVAVEVIEGEPETRVGGFAVNRDLGRVVAGPRYGTKAGGDGNASSGDPGSSQTAAASVDAIPSAAASSQPSGGTAASASKSTAASEAAATSGVASGSAGPAERMVSPSAGATVEVSSSTAPGAPPSPGSPASTTPAGTGAPASLPGAVLKESPQDSGSGAASAKSPSLADMGPEELLAAARSALSAGKPADALAALDRYRALMPAGSDEVWWLYGQVLESPGSTRDVKAALSWYHRLMDEYPQSARYDEARKRTAYLERYYLNIR